MRTTHLLVAAMLCAASAASSAQTLAQDTSAAAALADDYSRFLQATDIEEKIRLGEQALTALSSTQDWRLPQPRDEVFNNLHFGTGLAYMGRPGGARVDNIERAVTHFEAALTHLTRESNAYDWAALHANAGATYLARERGEATDNIEKAIAHFSLTGFSRETNKREWATASMNLGGAYLQRLTGDETQNLEAAIRQLDMALPLLTPQEQPNEWAVLNNMRAIAFTKRKSGEKADNQEAAIAALQAALAGLTREQTPIPWATTHLNLASGYAGRTSGSRADNEDKALAHLQDALTVYTRDAYPFEWAKLQVQLGGIYRQRQEDPARNEAEAAARYAAALEVYSRETYPLDHLLTSKSLIALRMEQKNWQEAARLQESARDAFLLLIGQGIDDNLSRQLMGDAGTLFTDAAYTALQLGDTDRALQWANEGRGRQLSLGLRIRDLSDEAQARVEALREDIRAQQAAAENASGAERLAAIETLSKRRQEIVDLLKAGSAQQRSARDTLYRLLDDGGVFAMPVVTHYGGKVMVLCATGGEAAWDIVDLPEFTRARVAALLAGPKPDVVEGWIKAYFVNYLDPDEQDSEWPTWLKAIDDLGPDLWALFAGAIDKVLKARGVERGTCLVWMPDGLIGIFPLGLAQKAKGGRRLGDDYEIVQAATLDLLAASQARALMPAEAPRLAAIVNPTGDLPGADLEAEIAAAHFSSEARIALQGKEATPSRVLDALNGATYWHFASHGTFDWQDPRQSGLILTGEERLSVGQLLDSKSLGHPRLVVLSACETGLSDIAKRPDEFTGLPAAFNALGATGVIGSLWPVADNATALLMAKFYDLHLSQGLPPSAALRQAQIWLRSARQRDLDSFAKTATRSGQLSPGQLAELTKPRKRLGGVNMSARPPSAAGVPTRSAPPFAHPYYWAAFVYTGL
jgi:hypothetical protein